jgi:hypothetical protein
MVDADAIRQRWEAVGAKLDERGRRLFAAAEARRSPDVRHVVVRQLQDAVNGRW